MDNIEASLCTTLILFGSVSLENNIIRFIDLANEEMKALVKLMNTHPHLKVNLHLFLLFLNLRSMVTLCLGNTCCGWMVGAKQNIFPDCRKFRVKEDFC